jgi:hypothetical protein
MTDATLSPIQPPFYTENEISPAIKAPFNK